MNASDKSEKIDSADVHVEGEDDIARGDHKRACVSQGATVPWISKVETVRENPKLRAMEEEIRELERRRTVSRSSSAR